MSQTSPSTTDVKGVAGAFGLQIAICAVVLTAFSILRPSLKAVYEPKNIFASNALKKPQQLNSGPLAWLAPVFKIAEMDLIDQIGMDSIIFLRFISLCFKFFAGLMLVAVPLMIFNAVVPNTLQKSAPTTFRNLTITNSLQNLAIRDFKSDPKFYYVYAVATLIVSVYAYVLLYLTWMEYMVLRNQLLKSREHLESPHCRTVLLNGLSAKLLDRNEVVKLISSIYKEAEIDQIVFGRDFKELTVLCEDHSKINDNMEQSLNKYFSGKKRPTHNSKGILGVLTFTGEKQDSILTYGMNLTDLEEKIYGLRSKGDDAFSCKSNAFVSFKNLRSAQKILKNVLLPRGMIKNNPLLSSAKIRECPPFDDLIWKNIGLDPKTKQFRRLITWGLTAALTIGWTVIISLISSLATIETISRLSKKVGEKIESSEAAMFFLQSIIAPGLLAAMIPVLLMFLHHSSVFQGIPSWNGVAQSVLRKFFFFQIYQFLVVLGVKIAWDYVKDPSDSSKVQDIQKSIVKGFQGSSTFYINYIIINFVGYCVELLQGARFFMIWFYNTFMKPVPRKLYDLKKAPELGVSTVICNFILIFLYCISYSVAAPLIVPFATILFGLSYIVFKYQQLYVYETTHESGGRWWPKIFNLLCFSIGFFQLMTGGCIWISGEGNAKAQSSCILIQCIITFAYWFVVRAKFKRDALSIEYDLPSNSNFNLEYLICDPAMGDPLAKVWVKEEFKSKLPIEYNPKYSNTVEYMNAKGIENLGHLETLTQRSRTFGLRHKKDVPAGTPQPPEIFYSLKDLKNL